MRSRVWPAAEVAVAIVVVAFDLLIPSLVLCALGGLSLLARRERPSTVGVRRLAPFGRAVAAVLALVVAWTALQLALLMPLAERVTGQRQDVSAFAEVEGDLPLLLVLLALSWTLGALVEELAFRGYLMARVAALLPPGAASVGAAVVSAVLFGLIHTEQGLVGVLLTTADGLFFAWLRLRFDSVWAAVIGHGANNTIGLTAYFLVGPVYALW